MHFDIQPYVGALPITFGMNREQAHHLIGLPEASFPIWNGSGVTEHYDHVGYNVGYSNDGRVNHVGFFPRSFKLSIQGRPIWTKEEQPDPNHVLLALDPEPLDFVGFWYFMKLGVRSSGYHDDEIAQRAIAVFPRGSTDELLAESDQADTSKYRTG